MRTLQIRFSIHRQGPSALPMESNAHTHEHMVIIGIDDFSSNGLARSRVSRPL
jgi:hypothetical protein